MCDNYERCYEYTAYGDNYYIHDDGELACLCDVCVYNENNWEDGYWIGNDPYDI